VIREQAPDVVTLNEVCQADVDELGQALAEVHAGETVVWAFQAARHGRTGDDYRCLNGDQYGVGLLVHVLLPHREYATHSGIYPVQDPADPEERAWLCIDAAAFYACTTHLAYTRPDVTLAQCQHMVDTVVPEVRARGGY
jgi:hypothetical protein